MTQKASQGSRHSKGSTLNGWAFRWASSSPRFRTLCMSWPQESELLRFKAFLLFRKLAKVVRVSKKRFFKEEVKRAWVPLMLHCQDPCPDAARVRFTLRVLPKSGPTGPERKLVSGSVALLPAGFLSVSRRAQKPRSRRPQTVFLWGLSFLPPVTSATHPFFYWIHSAVLWFGHV